MEFIRKIRRGVNMKAYRVYLQDMWIEYGIEYALSYDTALRIFNNKLRKLMRDTKDDWCDKVDFGEKVLSFRDQLKWHEDIEIVFRKNPIIMYKDKEGLKADVYHWEEPSYEYGESDIKNQAIILEEIEINE